MLLQAGHLWLRWLTLVNVGYVGLRWLTLVNISSRWLSWLHWVLWFTLIMLATLVDNGYAVTQVNDWFMLVVVGPVYSHYAGFAGLRSLMLAMLITLL